MYTHSLFWYNASIVGGVITDNVYCVASSDCHISYNTIMIYAKKLQVNFGIWIVLIAWRTFFYTVIYSLVIFILNKKKANLISIKALRINKIDFSQYVTTTIMIVCTYNVITTMTTLMRVRLWSYATGLFHWTTLSHFLIEWRFFFRCPICQPNI